MNFEDLKAKDSLHICGTYGRFQVAVESGKGAICHDGAGKEYIDFTSGIGVNALGFCDEGWQRAVTAQLGLVQHISNLYYTEPCVRAAELLCEKTGMNKVFFANSGAEANECAIKAARKYSFQKYGPGRHDIVTLENSFHGRTMATLAATGQESFHNYFFPFPGGFSYAKANDLAGTLDKMTDTTCAVLIELIQGEGGVLPLDPAYVSALADACAARDILLLVDEVQTGMGRTGTLFAFQQFGIVPDIVTSAKGLGGGLPIGAALFNQKTAGALTAGDHGSTFGGNPIACAGACEILTRMDGEFLAQVKAKGAYLVSRLEAMPHIQSVAGMGLMLGIEVECGTAKEIASQAAERGLLVLTAKHKVRFLPPLTITMEELDKGLAIFQGLLEALQ